MKDTQNKFKTSKEKEEEFISKHFHFNNKKNANADKTQQQQINKIQQNINQVMTKVKEKYGVGGSPTKNVTDSSLAQPSPWNNG